MLTASALDELMSRIGKNLHAVRHLKHEKTETVAKAVQVSRSVISQIENGKYLSLTVALLERLARHYDTTVENLILPERSAKSNTENFIEDLLFENKVMREKLAEFFNERRKP